jgi:CBS domain-containing protein
MEEIARFLAQHPPFDLLPPDVTLRAANVIQIDYIPAEQDILTQGGAQAEFLYVIRRGSVDMLRVHDHGTEILDTLTEGDLFGYVSLIRERAPILTVRTREELLVYLLPKATFHQLRGDYPAFAQFFARSLTERLDRALQDERTVTDTAFFHTRLRDLIRRPLVTIAPDATVRAAAQLMCKQDVSSLVVEHTPSQESRVRSQESGERKHQSEENAGTSKSMKMSTMIGIVTDRDLRTRVLAAGLSDTTPIAEVMSRPARAIPADSLVFEGLLQMLEHSVHHLLLMEEGRVIGVVTHTDIIRRTSQSPLFLPRQLQRAQSIDDLRAYGEQIMSIVGLMLDGKTKMYDIGRVVALAHDALLARLLQDAEHELGSPPCPYAWLVLGSEGRYEQTLRTDQDNALVYADHAPAEAERYFTQLAERVVNGLIDCGFPRCPGDIMATNPQWRQPVAVWQNYFRRWIMEPEEEALLRAAIFFDYRQVYGALDAEAALRPIVLLARNQRIFLGRLARAALRNPAPLSMLRQLIVERRGAHSGQLDLKMRGTAMIVDLARIFALEAGGTATNTIERLRLSGTHGNLGESNAEELVTAFEFIGLLRLRRQYLQIQRSEIPTNYVPIASLDTLERRELKEALRTVERTQRELELLFQTALIA